MLDAELKMKLLINNRPWEHEPDNEEWVDQATGYTCLVWRHLTLGSLNGYVSIPKGHPVHGTSYKDIAGFLDVHGGLTYSNEDEETGEWMFGFDCAHGGDFSPKLEATLMRYRDKDGLEYRTFGEYRTFEWVKEQVVGLANQLKLIEGKSK